MKKTLSFSPFAACTPSPFTWALALLLLMFSAMRGHAAEPTSTAAISGRVINRGTGSYLEGADIALSDSGRSTTTARDGSFLIAGVSAGRHELQVFYTGLTPQTIPVTVAAGRTTELTIELTSQVYQLEAFTVQGEREGNAASITRQRNADNVMNVVSMDALGNVADGNIGTFLQRLPGTAGILANDDVTGLAVRGTPPAWNSVSVDGVRSSSAYADTDLTNGRARAVTLDQIPADFIKEVELIKALTPDTAADSIGGTANLVTKSALDLKERSLTFRVGSNYNTYRKHQPDWTPTGTFTYLTKLGGRDNIGIGLSGSFTEVNNFRDRVQMTRSQGDGRNTQFRTLNDDYDRTRAGGALRFNFRPHPELDLSAGVQYAYFSGQQSRTDWNISGNGNVADYSRVTRAQIEAGTQPRNTANAIAGVAPGFTDTLTEILHATFSNTEGRIIRHFRNWKFDSGLKWKFGANHDLNAQASYSPSENAVIFENMTVTRVGGFGLGIDTSLNRQRPAVRQLYGTTIAAGADLSGYTANRTVPDDRYGKQDVADVKVDYRKEWRALRVPLTFKAGANWREQYHTIKVTRPNWNYVGPDGVAGINPATGRNDDDLAQFRLAGPGYGLFNNYYAGRDKFNYAAFTDVFRRNPSWFRPVGTTVSATPTFNDITEAVSAAYVMGRAQVGKLNILGGLRFEKTDVTASGTLTDPRNTGRSRATRESDYTNSFPSLHFKYEVRKGLLLRAAYSTGIARPDFDALYPNTTVSYDDALGTGVVRSNDPGLSPQYSKNYDLSAEYYYEPVGVFSVGWFHKDISKFIATETRPIGSGADNGFDGQYDGFDWITSRNYGDATIQGFEVNYSQQLQMLPKPFNTTSVFANYTRLRTQGQYGSGVTELAQFVPRTANAGVSLRIGKAEVRVAYNFNGGYLRTFNANAFVAQRNAAVEMWDVNLQYTLKSRYKLYVDARNVFNKWPYWYTGNDNSRVVMSEVFGTRISAGVSGRF